MTQDFRSVGRDEPLQNLFAMFTEKSFPIAVVDDEKRLLGVVVKGAVLDELAQAQEQAQAGENS
jgi:glycine betaine/proline transport system ATP-binding protein